MKTYKVIQWATGVVGTAAPKGVIRHPKLELVGVKVYNDEKAGKDAEAPACRDPRAPPDA